MKALKIVFNIGVDMRGQGYDGKTISEVLDRLEHKMFPEDFKK